MLVEYIEYIKFLLVTYFWMTIIAVNLDNLLFEVVSLRRIAVSSSVLTVVAYGTVIYMHG